MREEENDYFKFELFNELLIVMEGKEEAKSIQNLDLSPLHKGPSQGGCYESKGFRPSNF